MGGRQQQQAGSGIQGGPQATGARPAGGMGRAPSSRERSLLRPVSVDDVVAEDVVTAERDTPIRTAVAKMAERDVGSVVVVEDDRPIGILTDRKIALTLEENPNVADETAEELIDGDLISVDASTSIFDALQLMSDETIRRLPVVDDEGRLRGIVTLDDALVLLASELDKLATTVERQSPRL
ncbi:CBS domain-containing protein [Halosimplex salinum]|uniref:CBS domain-containing protein n=1 Tax=Halosimplex salinum TaxID=1710538 RepID=UPI0013DE6FAE|nr:CBS domain-containing protein [Halosimplex salinum]